MTKGVSLFLKPRRNVQRSVVDGRTKTGYNVPKVLKDVDGNAMNDRTPHEALFQRGSPRLEGT